MQEVQAARTAVGLGSAWFLDALAFKLNDGMIVDVKDCYSTVQMFPLEVGTGRVRPPRGEVR
jgi:hypothetical protein